MPAGRPPKLPTPEIQEKIFAAVRNGNYRYIAAEWAGVALRTFHRWCREGKKAKTGKFKKFWQSLLEAERDAEIRTVERIMEATESDPKLGLAWLKMKYPERWSENRGLIKQMAQEIKEIKNGISAPVAKKTSESQGKGGTSSGDGDAIAGRSYDDNASFGASSGPMAKGLVNDTMESGSSSLFPPGGEIAGDSGTCTA